MAILAYGIGGKSLTDLVLLAGLSFLPLIINLGALLVFLPFSILLGPCLSRVKSLNFPGVLAGMVHGTPNLFKASNKKAFSVIGMIVGIVACGVLSNWLLPRTLLALCGFTFLQRAIIRIFVVTLLSRELPTPISNQAWWTGTFCCSPNFSALRKITQPIREFGCKWVELYHFSTDFVVCHVILFALFPVCWIPFVDRVHTRMLLWISPKDERVTVQGKKRKRLVRSPDELKMRKQRSVVGAILFLSLFLVFLVLTVVPWIITIPVTAKMIPFSF